MYIISLLTAQSVFNAQYTVLKVWVKKKIG